MYFSSVSSLWSSQTRLKIVFKETLGPTVIDKQSKWRSFLFAILLTLCYLVCEKIQVKISTNSHQFLAGYAWSSQPALWTRGTSPGPVWSRHLRFYLDVSFYNRNQDGGPPTFSGGAGDSKTYDWENRINTKVFSQVWANPMHSSSLLGIWSAETFQY